MRAVSTIYHSMIGSIRLPALFLRSEDLARKTPRGARRILTVQSAAGFAVFSPAPVGTPTQRCLLAWN